MPYITQKSESSLIAGYKNYTGKEPTWLGKVFGKAVSEIHYQTFEAFAIAEEAICPDWWPMNNVGDVIRGIAAKIYDLTAGTIYYWGAQEGDKIVGEFENAVSDTKAKIEKAISDARTKIETELINPLKNKIATEIEPKVRDLLNRINSAETTIKDAENRINEALTDVSNLKNNIASLNTQVNALRGKIDETTRDFNAKITDLNDRLNSAKTYVDEHTKDIKELFKRIEALEEKTKTQGSSVEWLKSKLEGLM